MMLPEDAQKLRDLHKRLWDKHTDTFNWRYPVWFSEARALTPEEWDFIKACAEHLAIHLHNACMGFGVGMTLLLPPPVPGVDPEVLIDITNKHLGSKKRFEDGWNAFHPLASTQRNIDLLAYLELPPLRDKYYYDY